MTRERPGVGLDWVCRTTAQQKHHGGQTVLLPAVLEMVWRRGGQLPPTTFFLEFVMLQTPLIHRATIHQFIATHLGPFYIFKLIHLTDSYGDLLCARL